MAKRGGKKIGRDGPFSLLIRDRANSPATLPNSAKKLCLLRSIMAISKIIV